MDAAPPMIIEIPHKPERHDVREEIIENVARLLCRAAGDEPDRDVRAGGNTFQTVYLPEPTNRAWYRYRDEAEQKLREIFKAR